MEDCVEAIHPLDYQARRNGELSLVTRIDRPEPDPKPFIKWDHPDQPLLVCADGTLAWPTLIERLGVRAGWLSLGQLDRKYNSEPRQSAG